MFVPGLKNFPNINKFLKESSWNLGKRLTYHYLSKKKNFWTNDFLYASVYFDELYDLRL